ncbi:protein jagunal isoform X1 [Octopus sinensis]|uniref:Protein jagunal isoform X1 n=1 Tax=Octopus sinensis TaxID=2607531 RepID=A0A6P7U1A3_9MOLL|nr:protein jagunal isoform X1 [Octopus sinensis]
MASMTGGRPAGSDGSDFWHRESIAWQHKQSVQDCFEPKRKVDTVVVNELDIRQACLVSCINKSRLKFDIVIHSMLSILMFVRLLPCLVAFLGTSSLESIRKWDVPNARPWEYIWFISSLSAYLGWKAMAKNDIILIKQYIIGGVVFGVLPVLYGFVDQGDDFYDYIMNKQQSSKMLGFPAVLIWFMFLAISAQIHGLGLYFSIQLIRAWKPRKKKTK